MNRINNSDSHLKHLIKDNEQFYVGLLFEDYCKCVNLEKHKLPTQFTENKEVTPYPCGSTTKVNLKGKFVRTNPETKTTKRIHISYYHKRWKKQMDFNRDYNVYVKELQHKFEMPLTFITNSQGQQLVISPLLTFSSTDKIKNTHAINIFCEIFKNFEVLNTDMSFAIPITKILKGDILPSGKLTDKDVKEKLTAFSKYHCKDNEEHKAFIDRLKILEDLDLKAIAKGPQGMKGYIVFGSDCLNFVIVETVHINNATYIFKKEEYKNIIHLDKQTVLNKKLEEKRFYHQDKWQSNITKYVKKHTIKDN